jgi:circadian clock protein KaiB
MTTTVATPAGDRGAAYKLQLFVTGHTVRSLKAVNNIKQLCDELLPGRYQLDVVDLYQQPELAAREQLVAAPTLIKRFPLPQRRLVGDMSNRDRLLAGLGLAS